jgi:hypothetical protein
MTLLGVLLAVWVLWPVPLGLAVLVAHLADRGKHRARPPDRRANARSAESLARQPDERFSGPGAPEAPQSVPG